MSRRPQKLTAFGEGYYDAIDGREMFASAPDRYVGDRALRNDYERGWLSVGNPVNTRDTKSDEILTRPVRAA
jgi:hypothetical protein